MKERIYSVPDLCKQCGQLSHGTCLVFSVNVHKYGMPKECDYGRKR